ncbi:MAG: glycosyltransferase [Acidobacteriota bacterium]
MPQYKTALFLTSCYPKWVGEPSGIFLHHLAKALTELGWRVIVLTPNFPGGRKEEVLEGVLVRRVSYFLPRWQRLCYGSGILPNLRKAPWIWLQVPFYVLSMLVASLLLVRRKKIDLIHAHWLLPQGIVTRLLRVFSSVPIVMTLHGGDVFAFGGRVGRFCKGFALGKTSCCTANSLFTREAVQRIWPKTKITVIPMGVDLDHFRSVALGPCRAAETPIILFVGRLVQKKGVEFLLRAMPEVLTEFPQARLVIIGDGSQRGELEALAEGLGLGSVSFLGMIPHDKLPEHYSKATIFVGPSVVDDHGDTEGLGVVFLEAAASALPIIATGVGGISDIVIDDVTGIRVEPKNVRDLAEAIRRLLRDPDLCRRLGDAARVHAAERFSWTYTARHFSDLFDEVLQETEMK